MSRIRILDSEVVDRIAAGEVVERPASVVKELVENALDAGATRVEVRVEEGGAELIEVRDDGHGLDAGDADLAFAQHATSKVSTVDDLDAIDTLGFRGEALASIAAVARVELTSGTGEGAGVRLRVEGGQKRPVERLARPRGTTVRVENLFYNTPARRKHLKTRATELGHISEVVADYALARPDVMFRLQHGERSVLAAPPVSTLAERVHQVLGSEAAEHWLAVERHGSVARIHGGITGPDYQRPDRRQIRWFVNGRPVSDHRLTHALEGAYESLLDPARHPAAALFVDVDVTRVDVNVHPRKAEVRFADPGAMYGSVRSAARETLARHLPPRTIRAMAERRRDPQGQVDAAGPSSDAGASGLGPADGGASARRPAGGDDRPPPHAALPLSDWIVAEGSGPREDVHAAIGAASAPEEGKQIAGTRGPIQPLAQYANTYILAADEDGLLIIDQHVAHERILYERFLDRLEVAEVEAQRLLVPETVDLTAAEVAVLEERGALLESMGFEIEPFGGDSWAIQTAPTILDGKDLGPALRRLLDVLEGGGTQALDEARRQAAATLSCHAAVRARHPLSREEMVQLVADLHRCEAATRCPHGRPVLLRVELDEIQRRLGRT